MNTLMLLVMTAVALRLMTVPDPPITMPKWAWRGLFGFLTVQNLVLIYLLNSW